MLNATLFRVFESEAQFFDRMYNSSLIGSMPLARLPFFIVSYFVAAGEMAYTLNETNVFQALVQVLFPVHRQLQLSFSTTKRFFFKLPIVMWKSHLVHLCSRKNTTTVLCLCIYYSLVWIYRFVNQYLEFFLQIIGKSSIVVLLDSFQVKEMLYFLFIWNRFVLVVIFTYIAVSQSIVKLVT